LPLAQSHVRTKVRENFGVNFYLSVWLGFGHGKKPLGMKGHWLRHVGEVSGGAFTVLQPV